MSNTEAYPLSWPTGWPRTKHASRARFGLKGQGVSVYMGLRGVQRELSLLGAKSVVITTNIPIRLDGLPYSKTAEPSDHGASVYFRVKDEPRVLAADKWDRVSDNLQAIKLHVESMRGQLRWGIGSMEQAFGGYRALPAMPPSRTWFEILDVDQDSPWEAIEAKRIALLARHHPDVGGQTSVAAEINAAFDEARRERQAP